jgi:AraC-like DNA-binding protein
MDAAPDFMENITVMKKGAFFYFRPERQPEPRALCVQGLGIREIMPRGYIHHGGQGAPFLFMCFHAPAVLNPDRADLEDAGGATIFWPAGAVHHYGNGGRQWLHSWMNISGEAVTEAFAENRIPLGRLLRFGVRRLDGAFPRGRLDDCAAPAAAGRQAAGAPSSRRATKRRQAAALQSGPASVDDGQRLFQRYLKLLYDELHGHVPPDPVVLDGIVRLWLRETARALRGKGEGSELPERLRTVRQHIEANLHDSLRLEDLAARAHLSISQFCAVFNKHFGTSPLQFVHALRMKRAEMLLADQNLMVYEVAERVGYSDALLFSKQFRRHFGVSPRGYRGKASGS